MGRELPHPILSRGKGGSAHLLHREARVERHLCREDYKDIYVTTAGGDNKAENGPGAGSLFRLRTGIRGVPEFFSRIEEQ